MASTSNSTLITLFSVLIAGGGLGYGVQIVQAWLKRPRRGLINQQIIDASIITVARARDELEEDNLRIRATLAEERRNWASERERFERDRAAWDTDRARFRAEITALEQRIVEERAAAATRYDALLIQVQHLRQRTEVERDNG